MKRKKGTQVYLDIVNKYCTERRIMESQQKDIDHYAAEIAEDEKVFNSLDTNIENYEFIKRWYDESMGVKKQLIGLTKGNMRYSEERIEKYASCLKNDYEEDLDVLYYQYIF